MNMQKITLSMVGLLAAAAFAPEASAIPAFARQVGMACSACHYQHFPAINAFGRAFKEGGYTMVGAQEKIEGDGISLPNTLNAALVGSAGYQKTNGPSQSVNSVKSSSNDGQLVLPQGVSLFLGGRGGEHVGFEAEIALNSGGVAGSAGIIRFKVPFVYDLGAVKASIIPFATANGVADSFEVLNTGAVNVHAFNQQDMPAVSAQQYIGTGGAAHGVAFVADNENFFVNVAKWGATPGDGSGAPSSNYVRAAWTTDFSGFDTAIGGQYWGGTSATSSTPAQIGGTLAVPVLSPGVAGGPVDTKAWAIDAQTMGDVGGMPLLVTASYARAPSDTTRTNLFNQTGTMNKSSFNIGAELGVVPNKATVQLALRRASSGLDAGTVSGAAATGKNASDNAYLIGGTYAMALNTRLELSYSKYSGGMYGASVAAADLAANTVYAGDSLIAATLWFGF